LDRNHSSLENLQIGRLETEENQEWGYARNMQLLIKSAHGEYSSSAYSTTLNLGGRPFYGANRDYSWQGLLVGPLKGSLFKALDGIYFSTGLTLAAREVLFKHDSFVHRYVDEEGRGVEMVISLRSRPGQLVLEASCTTPCWFAPILDSRPADSWAKTRDEALITGNRMEVTNSTTPLRLLINGFDSAERLGATLEWRYKLGDGFRRLSNNQVLFREHRREVAIPWILHSSSGSITFEIPLPSLEVPALTAPSPFLGRGPVAKAVELRVSTLSRMGLAIDGLWFPEAGAWWFRRPWTRDALEGLRWNLRTYLRYLGGAGKILDLLSRLGDVCKRSLGLPIMADGDGGFSSDAPPMMLKVLSDFGRVSGSQDALSRAVDLAEVIASTLLSGKSFSGSLLSHSIICSPANSSWVDSVTTLDDRRWPTRLPTAWSQPDMDPFAAEFGLVEVNALYIEAIQSLTLPSDANPPRVPEEVEELGEVLRSGFMRQFVRRGNLPYLTVHPSRGLYDATLGSPGVEAVYLLRDIVYDTPETERIWTAASERLLVPRELQALGRGQHPFGVLTRDTGPRPYLGDEDYHGPVVWPRDTPYLIGILETIGLDTRGVLLNNLDHMVSEGAYGYCGELFSLPVDATGLPGSGNPVPVKNPAQYWSHWCDPFLGRINELETFARQTRKSNAS